MDEVKRLRLEKEWSQNELAYHAKLAPSVISLIETGKRDPNATTLRKLAEALEVRIPDLFEESGSGKAPRRSSPEPSLFNGLEGERHDHDFLKARNSLDRFCGYWDERLAGGDITRREFEDLGAVINCWVPILFETLAAERNELLAAGKAGDVGSSVIWPAVERFLALGDRLGKLEHDLYGADKDAEKRRSSFGVLEGMRSTG